MPGNLLGQRWRWLTFLCIASLLLMILVRLIWLQRRQYHPDLEMRTMIGAEVLLRENITICNNIKNIVFLWPRIRRQESDAGDRNLLAWYSSRGTRYLISRFHCGYGEGGEQHFIEINQKLLMAVVFFCALGARFLTGSWLASLVVATVLLSRGRAFAEVGSLSILLWIKALLALWFALLVHHVRTASLISLVGGILVLGLLTLLERSFLAIALLFPCCFFALFVVKWLLPRPFFARFSHRGKADHTALSSTGEGALTAPEASGSADWMELRFLARFVKLMGFLPGTHHAATELGGSLSPLQSPFFAWVYRHRKIWLFMKIHLMFFALLFIATLWMTLGDSIGWAALWHPGRFFSISTISDQWFFGWIATWVRPIDIDLGVALAVILTALIKPWPFSRLFFREISMLALQAVALSSLGAWFWDCLDASFVANNLKSFWIVTANLGPRAGEVFLWWDPILITLGISGLIHIYISLFLPARPWRIKSSILSSYNKRE